MRDRRGGPTSGHYWRPPDNAPLQAPDMVRRAGRLPVGKRKRRTTALRRGRKGRDHGFGDVLLPPQAEKGLGRRRKEVDVADRHQLAHTSAYSESDCRSAKRTW